MYREKAMINFDLKVIILTVLKTTTLGWNSAFYYKGFQKPTIALKRKNFFLHFGIQKNGILYKNRKAVFEPCNSGELVS